MFLQTLTCLISMIRYYMGWMSAKTKVYNTRRVMVAIIATVSFLYFFISILYTIRPPPACMNNFGTPSAFFKRHVHVLLHGVWLYGEIHIAQFIFTWCVLYSLEQKLSLRKKVEKEIKEINYPILMSYRKWKYILWKCICLNV